MSQLHLEELIDHVREFLDTDPRFFNKDAGEFEWFGQRVGFQHTEKATILFVAEVEFELLR